MDSDVARDGDTTSQPSAGVVNGDVAPTTTTAAQPAAVGTASSTSAQRDPTDAEILAETAKTPCPSDISEEHCARARAALVQDMRGLIKDANSPEIRAWIAEQERLAAELPSRDEIIKQNCKEWRGGLAHLQRMRNPPRGEIVTPDEAAAIPGEIAKLISMIEENCN